MEKRYRNTVLKKAEKATIEGNSLLAEMLQFLVKVDDEVDECKRAQKRAANRGEYRDAIELEGVMDANKKISWNLQKILKLR